MDVSKITYLSHILNIKDSESRQYVDAASNYNNFDFLTNAKIVISGDSIAEGFGWFVPEGGKNDSNDGFAALFRERFPSATVKNVAVSGSTMANPMGSAPSVLSQIGQIDSDTDLLIVIAGVNDFTFVNDGTAQFAQLGKLPDGVNTPANTQNTTFGAIKYYLDTVKVNCPNCKIIWGVINSAPTADYDRWFAYFGALKRALYRMGVYVMDFNNYIPVQSARPDLYYDFIHYNEAGYKFLFQSLLDFIRAPSLCDDFGNGIICPSDSTNSKEEMLKQCAYMYDGWWDCGFYKLYPVGTPYTWYYVEYNKIAQDIQFTIHDFDGRQETHSFAINLTAHVLATPIVDTSDKLVRNGTYRNMLDFKTPGIYAIPSALFAEVKNLPNGFGINKDGYAVVEVTQHIPNITTGFLYNCFADAPGEFYRWTNNNGAMYYWKITETLL